MGVSRRDRRIDADQVRSFMNLGFRSDQAITRYHDEGEGKISCVMALALDKKLNFLLDIFMSQETYGTYDIEAVIAMSDTDRQEALDRMFFIACEMASYQKNMIGEDPQVTLSNIFTLLDVGASVTTCFDELNSLANLANILDVDKLSEILSALSAREFSVQDLVIAMGDTPRGRMVGRKLLIATVHDPDKDNSQLVLNLLEAGVDYQTLGPDIVAKVEGILEMEKVNISTPAPNPIAGNAQALPLAAASQYVHAQ